MDQKTSNEKTGCHVKKTKKNKTKKKRGDGYPKPYNIGSVTNS